MPPTSRYPSSSQSFVGSATANLASGKGNGTKSRHPLPSRPGTNASTASDKGKAKEEVEIESFDPPAWRTVLNQRADLGFPDFYPSRPGFHQLEDVLTEDNVKNGFSSTTTPTGETFSMRNAIIPHMMAGCPEMLMALGQAIVEKRDELMPKFEERAFRIPVRVTYNDSKRLQFLTDLANPKVPLHRLMRNPVPHGFKGTELFESMFSPLTSSSSNAGHNRTPSASGKAAVDPIPLDRALWFIRVLGSNEISAHRSRAQPAAPVSAPSPAGATPSSTNTTSSTPALPLLSNDWYTQEFTNLFTAWLRIQLVQLSLPARGPLKASVPAKVGSGVLGDEKARARWSNKWDYSISLLRELHSRRLISCRIFTGWLADNLASANLSQLTFVALLSAQYIAALARHVSHGRLWIRAALERIKDIRSAIPASEALKRTESLLVTIITALFDAVPVVLLNPIAWRSNAELISEVILSSSSNEKTGARRAQQLADVRRRSEALVFRPVTTESTTSPRRQQMEEIHKLDSVCADTNMAELCKSFFDGSSSPSSPAVDVGRLEEKVFILMNWAMGLFQLGGHRPYASHTLIKLWLEQFDKHQSRSNNPQTMDFFPMLYKWLDTSAAGKKSENVLAVGITFGEFIRQGVFSYSRYLQTLIARGHTARSRHPKSPPSHHLALLRTMPIFVQAKDLLLQRRLALSGDDLEVRHRDEMDEAQALEAFKEEVREYVPEIFGWKRYGRSAALRDEVNHQMVTATTLTRYLFLQARFWIVPAVAEKLASGKGGMDASTFVRVMHVFRLCCGFSTIADLLIKALRTSDDEDILRVVIDAMQRDGDAWTAIDRWTQVTDALMYRHRLLAKNKKHLPAFSDLLLQLYKAGRLDEQSGIEIRKAVKRHTKSRGEVTNEPDKTQERVAKVVATIRSGDVAKAIALGKDMAAHNRSLDSWGLTWWRQVIEALCSDPTLPGTQQDILSAALGMIGTIDDACEANVASIVKKWLESLSLAEITDIFGQQNSMLPVMVLLYLVAQRRIPSLPVISNIVFPIWRAVSASILGNRSRLQGKQALAVESSVILAQQLLLDRPPHAIFPPTTLCEAHIVQTARTKILHADNVPELIRHLPFLVVFGSTPGVADRTRQEVSDLLQSLAMLPEFKTAAFRQLDLLKDAFLSSNWSKPGIEPTVEAGMVETLKMIMSDGSIGSSKPLPSISTALNATARFSAWRWTRVVLEMRVEFKRLAMRIDHGENATEARQTLNQLVHITLDRDISADDADLLCETFRGIEPIAAQEIFSVGLERLATLLGPIIEAEQQSHLEPLARSLDLMLRILSSGRDDKPVHVDQATFAARHRLIDLISIAMQAVERLVSADADLELPDGISPPQPGELLSVILKVLKFILGMPIMEQPGPAAPRPDFARLTASYFKVLTVLVGQANVAVPEWFTDMLTYVIDAVPPQARNSLHSALAAEASTSTAQVAFAKSTPLSNALPHWSPARRQTTLLGIRSSDEDSSDFALPLDDRSWELFEQMTPAPPALRHRDRFLASQPLKDTSSMPIALFKPRIIRDCLPQSANVSSEMDEGEIEVDEGYLGFASERNLGDGLAGEPLAVKQTMTQLYSASDDMEVEIEIDLTTTKSDIAESPANSISAVSAATATRPRRASTRLATGVRPNHGMGSNKDPITIGDDGDDDDDNDDESDLEAADEPLAKRARIGSKTTAATASRATTGGKAPSKKTTGGKAPAKRTTGGKSVRGHVGSKAPRGGGGRRRSGVD
ncbi:hypothetical protein BCR39DRAFT_548068 [Naematelia encephala]|uniref:Mediator of RNA polymerase II transcription subunit 12 n=1 Tax=Naematelia encephala TaxID=71784 RepID=A0A1Y2AN64_9TREE|nr:hypothetical protein BCR39DRAFT_548068 [Naematelia encephala]